MVQGPINSDFNQASSIPVFSRYRPIARHCAKTMCSSPKRRMKLPMSSGLELRSFSALSRKDLDRG